MGLGSRVIMSHTFGGLGKAKGVGFRVYQDLSRQNFCQHHLIVATHKWGFPKIKGTFLGVPIMRAIVFWGLYWGPLILGNYQIEDPQCGPPSRRRGPQFLETSMAQPHEHLWATGPRVSSASSPLTNMLSYLGTIPGCYF